MKDGFIRSREGRILGKFDADGRWLRDGQGKLVAHYDSINDVTRTRDGRIVGKSDLRSFQLGKSQLNNKAKQPTDDVKSYFNAWTSARLLMAFV
jgi:YD repeat-containing protein